MKTRILSAIVALAYFAIVLSLINVAPIVLVISISILSALAIWEILNETKLVENKVLTIGCCAFAFLVPICYEVLYILTFIFFNVVFALYLIIVSISMHSKTKPQELAISYAFTTIISFAFTSLMILIKSSSYGLWYLLLVCCFAWGSDTGAYFTGVFLGKHKLAPTISPKKTIEGAVGGLVICTILSLLIGIIFNVTVKSANFDLLKLGIITPFFSVLGIIGDLFASYIKRSCNIKDYGKIMPGHGGVLDRFDSLLLISPIFWLLIQIMPLIEKV